MRRSISLFKQLLKIEKLELSSLKRLLPTKRNKMEFDKVFDNVRVYTSYLGNALNSVPLESVFMGAIFHNNKQLLQITAKEDTVIDEDSLREEMISLFETKPEGKILFYRFSKKWLSFLYSLHKEDMVLDENDSGDRQI